MRLFAASFAAVLWAAASVSAGCPAGATPALSCPVQGGQKQLDLCIQGATLHYSFGRSGAAPDLALSVPVTAAEHQPWHGVGRSIWEATTLRNDGYAYEVYASVDRMVEDAQMAKSGGVTVFQGDKEVAHLVCDPGRAELTLWAVTDAKEAAGQCWRAEAQIWAPCN